MKEDNISQLGDYDAPFCEQQYTHGSCYISLFKFKSFDQFNTPQTASNFRHLLSCGTKAEIRKISKTMLIFSDDNKHLLDETESNIQFIASGQGNIGRSEAEPNIIFYGCNELDVGRGQVQ